MPTAYSDKLDQLANQEPLITKVRSNVSAPPPLTKVNSGPTTQAPYHPPLDLNPDSLTKGIEHYEAHSGYVSPAVQAFSALYVGLQKLSDAKKQLAKDPSKTEAQQVLMLAGEAEKLQDRCTRQFDDARKRLMDGIKGIDEMLSGPLTHKADNTLSGELRALCRSMTSDERAKFLNDAMHDRDMTVLTAILGGHHALSGLTKERRAHLTRQFHEATNPEVTQRLAVMRSALERVEQRAGLVLVETQRALGAKWDVVQKLRTAGSASEAALLLINNPPQS